MIPYWLIFLIPALFALYAHPVAQRNADGTVRGRIDLLWISTFVVLILFIGLRFEVGGDWSIYLWQYEYMKEQSYSYILSRFDLAHWFLNKLISDLGLGITGVNTAYGAIFSVGLIAFARVQPRPWVALASAVPYLIIVVAMGYSRQGVAIGLAFLGLVALRRGCFICFALWICVAATFHTAALFLLAIGAFAIKTGRLKRLAGVGVVLIVLYEFYLADHINHMMYWYVAVKLHTSEGALIRLMMNSVAAIMFLFFRRAFILNSNERQLWTIASFVALVMMVCYFLTGLSTALDRLALYLIPLQLVTAAHLPDAFGSAGKRNNGIIFFILLYFFAVQFVWLNFANHSSLWLPYQMAIVPDGTIKIRY